MSDKIKRDFMRIKNDLYVSVKILSKIKKCRQKQLSIGCIEANKKSEATIWTTAVFKNTLTTAIQVPRCTKGLTTPTSHVIPFISRKMPQKTKHGKTEEECEQLIQTEKSR